MQQPESADDTKVELHIEITGKIAEYEKRNSKVMKNEDIPDC